MKKVLGLGFVLVAAAAFSAFGQSGHGRSLVRFSGAIVSIQFRMSSLTVHPPR